MEGQVTLCTALKWVQVNKGTAGGFEVLQRHTREGTWPAVPGQPAQPRAQANRLLEGALLGVTSFTSFWWYG